VVLPRAFLLHANGTRHSLHPLLFWRVSCGHNSGVARRENTGVRLTVCYLGINCYLEINEEKRFCHSHCERSNPEASLGRELDCFVAFLLGMTASDTYRPYTTGARRTISGGGRSRCQTRPSSNWMRMPSGE
jgi:hypothetical protein